MRKAFPLSAVLLVFCVPLACSQEVPLQIKGGGVSVVKVDRVIITKVDQTLVSSFPFTVSAPPGVALYFWSYPAGVTATDQGDSLEVTAAPKGDLTISVKGVSVDWDNKKFKNVFGKVTFSVGEPGPPIPPVPQPSVGLKVLIVEDSSVRTKLPASQQLVILGKPMRDWLNANCSAEKALDSGKAWAIWDKDADASAMPKFWQDALARKRASVPWIVVGDDNGSWLFEGPLPANVADTMALLSKYVPAKLKKAG